MFQLNGRRALITGASGGIGFAIAKRLHQAGATVFCTGRREAPLKELVASLGERAHYGLFDLGAGDVDALLEGVDAQMGGVDILVNNAGKTADGLMMRMKDDQFDEVLNVNLRAPFQLMRGVMREMLRQRFGRIINMSSIVGVIGNPGQANYVAAKAALIGVTKTLAGEIGSRGVTVNCIAPGFIETPMTDVLADQHKEVLLARIPLGRMGTPEDIAAAVHYLASDEAAYVTGQTLHVNGGMAMI